MKKALVLILILILLCGCASATVWKASVLTKRMNVYSDDSCSGSPIGSLSRGTAFRVTKIGRTTAKISYNGITGWVRLKSVIFNARIKAVAKYDTAIRFVTKRSYAAGSSYWGTVKAGTTVSVAGVCGSRLLVVSDNYLGVVSKSAFRKK